MGKVQPKVGCRLALPGAVDSRHITHTTQSWNIAALFALCSLTISAEYLISMRIRIKHKTTFPSIAIAILASAAFDADIRDRRGGAMDGGRRVFLNRDKIRGEGIWGIDRLFYTLEWCTTWWWPG
jgi:hypothetical protein